MSKEQRILIALVGLLVLFVGFLVFRTFSFNQAIKEEAEYLGQLNNPQPSLESPTINLTNPSLGPSAASVTIVVFGSYDCSYCADLDKNLTQLAVNNPEKVRLVWKDFADPDKELPLKAAVAARCAQGQNKFWEFNRELMDNQSQLGDKFYLDAATELNLDTARFNQCYANQETLALVYSDFQEGLALGINATPYLYINNEPYRGALTLEDLQRIIDEL